MDAELKEYSDGMVDTLSQRIYDVAVSLGQRIDALDVKMTLGFQSLDERLLDMSGQLPTLDQRLARLGSLERNIGQLAKRVGGMDEGIHQRFRVLTERVGAIERRLAGV